MKCRKNSESKNPKVGRTKNGKTMVLSKYAVCDCRKSKLKVMLRAIFCIDKNTHIDRK